LSDLSRLDLLERSQPSRKRVEGAPGDLSAGIRSAGVSAGAQVARTGTPPGGEQ
jgi:hypothetical protein